MACARVLLVLHSLHASAQPSYLHWGSHTFKTCKAALPQSHDKLLRTTDVFSWCVSSTSCCACCNTALTAQSEGTVTHNAVGSRSSQLKHQLMTSASAARGQTQPASAKQLKPTRATHVLQLVRPAPHTGTSLEIMTPSLPLVCQPERLVFGGKQLEDGRGLAGRTLARLQGGDVVCDATDARWRQRVLKC